MDTTQAITTAKTTATALQTAQVFNSMQALETFGNYIFQSNMFGARNPAEGFVIGITCQQEGMTLLQFKERYHVMMGQVTIKSEAMLANLLELGGEYEIQARTPDRVAIKLTYKKASFFSEIKWEDIKDEAYTRANKDANGRNYADNVPIEQRRYKDNWSTPRRRMQMMWARAVSDGVRAVCPLATRGHYTPEEAVDFDEPKVVNITPAAAPAAYPQEAETASAAPAPARCRREYAGRSPVPLSGTARIPARRSGTAGPPSGAPSTRPGRSRPGRRRACALR